MKMMGFEQPVSAGKEVALGCLVRGARPPPRLAWYLEDRLVAETQTSAVRIPEFDRINIARLPLLFSVVIKQAIYKPRSLRSTIYVNLAMKFT